MHDTALQKIADGFVELQFKYIAVEQRFLQFMAMFVYFPVRVYNVSTGSNVNCPKGLLCGRVSKNHVCPSVRVYVRL